MNIFSFLVSLFQKDLKNTNFGVIQQDVINKAPSEKLFDQREIVAGISPATFNGINGDGSVRRFPYQSQAQSLSCVAFTTAKISTVLYYLLYNKVIKWSPAYWYLQRSNKPYGGMFFDDIVKLSATGAITHELLPCEGMSEEVINSLVIEENIKDVADGFALPDNWVEVPLDFDNVASTVEQTKKGVMLWFSFGAGEFFYTSYPKANSTQNPWNHSVTAVDTVTKNGVQYIVIEDSADQQNYYQKFISREFFNAKCFLARYPMNFKFKTIRKPKFDGSVISLQNCLKYEKLFPSNVNSTGYFGEITKQALILFQKKYGIEPSVGFFGDKTKAKLSELYS